MRRRTLGPKLSAGDCGTYGGPGITHVGRQDLARAAACACNVDFKPVHGFPLLGRDEVVAVIKARGTDALPDTSLQRHSFGRGGAWHVES